MATLARHWTVRHGLTILLLCGASYAFAVQPYSEPAGTRMPVQTSSTASQAQPQSGNPPDAVIVMKNIVFQPAELTVHPGEVVEWKNEDIVAHTVTANDGSFDSGAIPPGGTWKMTVTKPGTLEYHCQPHPNMTARLIDTNAVQSGKQNTEKPWRTPAFVVPKLPQEFHPILVNFTAALLPLALLSDLIGRILRRKSLHAAAAWMVLYAAAITPLTAAAGWWWKTQFMHTPGSLPANLILVHQWLGSTFVLVLIVLAIWRWRIQKRDESPGLLYLAIAAISTLALMYQGSLGGSMVFGR